MENMCIFQPKNGMRYDMAMSEHGFYAPIRFTISPGLTNTKVRFGGPIPSKMSKNRKSFLNWPLFFLKGFGGPFGG